MREDRANHPGRRPVSKAEGFQMRLRGMATQPAFGVLGMSPHARAGAATFRQYNAEGAERAGGTPLSSGRVGVFESYFGGRRQGSGTSTDERYPLGYRGATYFSRRGR